MKNSTLGALLALAICAPSPLLAADNITAKDGNGSSITICTKDQGSGVQASCHYAVPTENHLGEVSVPVVIASDTITMTSATTSWTATQLMGSSTTAASSKIMQLAVCRTTGGHAQLRRMRLKTGAADTGLAGQTIYVEIYRDSPTLTNGDRATWLTTESAWVGEYPITLAKHFSNSEKGISAPIEANIDCASGSSNVYALLVAGTSFAPQNASVTLTLVAEAEGR